MIKKSLFTLAIVVGLSSFAMAVDTAIITDLTAIKASTKADLVSAQPLALEIFGVMFGAPLVLAFFKRLVH